MKKTTATTGMTRASISRRLNSLGLLALYMQWMWVVIVCAPSLLQSNLILQTESTSSETVTQQSIATGLVNGLGPFQAAIGFVLVVVTILGIGYGIKRSSGVTTTATEKVLDSTTDYILPTITHGKKMSKKQKRHTWLLFVAFQNSCMVESTYR